MNRSQWTRNHRTLDSSTGCLVYDFFLFYLSASLFYLLILHYRKGTWVSVLYTVALEFLIQEPGKGKDEGCYNFILLGARVSLRIEAQ